MTGFHVAFAIPLIVVGWTGIHLRKSILGLATAILITWQGILALAAISVFQRAKPAEGAVLLWFLLFSSLFSGVSVLILGLRRYYSDRDVNLRGNEEIRN